jgi:hypothetical protein
MQLLGGGLDVSGDRRLVLVEGGLRCVSAREAGLPDCTRAGQRSPDGLTVSPGSVRGCTGRSGTVESTKGFLRTGMASMAAPILRLARFH